MSKKDREQFIQGVLGKVYSDLPDPNETRLRDLRKMSPEAQGRIVAKGLVQIEAEGEKINPVLQKMIDEGDYAGLAGSFGNFLTRKKQKLVETYGKPISGSDPEEASVDFEKVTKDEIQRARGENAVRLLQSLGVIDPDL